MYILTSSNLHRTPKYNLLSLCYLSGLNTLIQGNFVLSNHQGNNKGHFPNTGDLEFQI